MFDDRSLLENLVRGAGQPSQQAGGGGLGDLLGELARGLGQSAPGATAGGAGGGIGDLLRNLAQQQSGQQAQTGGSGSVGGIGDLLRNAAPQPGQQGQAAAPASDGGGLADILGKLQQQMGAQGGAAGSGGGLMDILGQVLGQATTGVKEGAQRIDQATGASDRMRDAISQATGKSPDDLLNQLKELIANNPGGAAAAGAGLGAVVLGTQAGRALAGSAVKLGALALIGGLAYKAMQNYQQGKPLIGSAQDPRQMGLIEAPRGSGFEAGAVTNEAAQLYIRGMIAAAAADGRIDAREQQKIMGGLKQAGLDAEAEEFLAGELNNPATPEQLASAVGSEQEAVQLFTAARIAVDLDSREEHQFLVRLANDLGLDGKLVAHIDAAARAA